MDAKKILYADDDEDDVKLLLIALQASGLACEVQAVSDGGEALDYLRCSGAFTARPPGNPRLVVLDVKMPMVDGFEALAQIRADPELNHIPVVMMSSSAHRGDIARCYALGANDYVVKSHLLYEFTATIRQIAATWVN